MSDNLGLGNHDLTSDRGENRYSSCDADSGLPSGCGGAVVSKSSSASSGNRLNFGDNLTVLREHIKDESVDLIYLDPPFNSNANYNVLFKQSDGAASEAQAEAFQDTWAWGEASAISYDEALRTGGDVALLMRSFRAWLGDNAMMAYIAMMGARLTELRRVLKPNGSLYLHCDPTASHYLKLMLDASFGHASYKNEIVWLRSKNPKGSQHAITRFGPATDAILYYTTGDAPFYPDRIRTKLSVEQIAEKYPSRDERGPYVDGPVLRSESMGRDKVARHYGRQVVQFSLSLPPPGAPK
jgi:site-specific DNA-methyltransferase (adenine-specific)